MTMEPSLRWLQEDDANNNGTTVLTILYLLVLFLCFTVPIFYWFRLHSDVRQERRLRELEIAVLTTTLQQSEIVHREERLAIRRKYREDRRARLLQLFSHVQMTLKKDHFPHLQDMREAEIIISEESNKISNTMEGNIADDIERGKPTLKIEKTYSSSDLSSENKESEIELLDATGKSIDFDNTFVEIPAPGLHVKSHLNSSRLVPNICTICLSNYDIGSKIVWSSNPSCEHAFHEECIEEWLLNQREGPLCPCCRQDFVVDPYDLEEELELGEAMNKPRH